MFKTIKYLFISIFILGSISQAIGQTFKTIPTQHLQLYKMIGDTGDHQIDTIQTFEVSDFITYKEYKKYLQSIKIDSSEKYYLTQLPDSNITIDTSVYTEYITSNDYDKYPVIGISWEAAINYCKWKTINDNKKDTIEFIYRLPYFPEWISSLYYYDVNNIKHDLNNKYTDWLMNTYDESFLAFRGKSMYLQYVYMHKDDDVPALKRKIITGRSYLFNQPINYYSNFGYRYGYSYIGYQQVSFRLVKAKPDKYLLKYWGLE